MPGKFFIVFVYTILMTIHRQSTLTSGGNDRGGSKGRRAGVGIRQRDVSLRAPLGGRWAQ